MSNTKMTKGDIVSLTFNYLECIGIDWFQVRWVNLKAKGRVKYREVI